MLRAATRGQCETCHTAPQNNLHKSLSGGCDKCHQTTAWKPATFDHNKFFQLDKDHNASCVTCHTGNDNRQYTCYGCHEHTPANIQAEHREEVGNEKLDNCVRCHRSANGEGGERGERRGGDD
jgi:hypothetical protein